MNDEYVDINDLETDVTYKGFKTPQQIMEHQFNVVHNRDWKSYLNSIEWDTWCKPYSPEEQAKRLIEINKRKAEIERENHPFNKFF